MGSTARGLPYPESTARPDVVADIRALAEATDGELDTLFFGPGKVLYTRTLAFADLAAGASRSAAVDLTPADFAAPPIVVVTFASTGFVLPSTGAPSASTVTVRGWNIGGSTAAGISCHIYALGTVAATP